MQNFNLKLMFKTSDINHSLASCAPLTSRSGRSDYKSKDSMMECFSHCLRKILVCLQDASQGCPDNSCPLFTGPGSIIWD